MEKKKRVLVIDDTDLMRNMLKTFLENTGYEVATATNAEEGMLRIDHEEFDLVISDIDMPGKSGHDVIEYVCQQNERKNKGAVSSTKTILMSGDDRHEKASKADHFHYKSSDFKKLIHAIESLIG